MLAEEIDNAACIGEVTAGAFGRRDEVGFSRILFDQMQLNWGASGALMVVPDNALHGPVVRHWYVWPAEPQAGTPIYPIGAQQRRPAGQKKPRQAPTAVTLMHEFALLWNGSVTDWAINPSRPPLAPETFPATGALMIYG